MRNYTIISAVPMEHYKHQKGFDVVISQKCSDGTSVESKIWIAEEEYKLRMFIQTNIADKILKKKELETLLNLIEEFGSEKYYEGSSDEAMSNDESI